MPPTIAEQVRMIERAEAADDDESVTALVEGAYASIEDDPQEIQVQRSKNTLFGGYLRELALEPRPDETPMERDRRLGGEITSDVDVPHGEGLTRSYFAGGTLELGDEFIANSAAFLNKIAGIDSNKSYSELYDAYLARERAKAKSFAQKHPGSDITAKIAGGVLSPFWKPLSTLSKLSFIPGAMKISAPTTMGQTIKQGAKAGGYGGALYGLGAGEGAEGRAVQTGIGAGAGAIFGTLLAPAFYGANQLAQRIMALRQSRKMGSIKDVPKSVQKELQSLAAADEARLGSGLSRMKIMGQDALFVDAGPATLRRLDEIIQSAGPGSLEAQQAIQARAEVIGRKLTKDLDDILGELEGVKTQEQLKSLYKNAGKIYQKAYGTPINYASDKGQELLNLIKLFPERVLREGNELLRVTSGLDKSIPSKQLKFILDDEGNLVLEELPSVAMIDYATRGLKSIVEREEGLGLMGGTTPLGKTLMDLSTKTRDVLKELVPSYRDALKMSSGNITDKNARMFSQEMLRPIHSRQDVFSALEKLGDRQLLLARKGLRQYLDDLMAQTKRAMGDPTTEANTIKEIVTLTRNLSSRENRDKLGFLLGPDDANRIFQRLQKQEIAIQTQAGIRENSATHARGVARDKSSVFTEPGPLKEVLGLEPVKAAQSAAKIFTGTDPASVSAARQAHDKVLAGILSGPARGTRDQSIPRLDFLARENILSARDAEFLSKIISGKTAPISGQLSRAAASRLFD